MDEDQIDKVALELSSALGRIDHARVKEVLKRAPIQCWHRTPRGLLSEFAIKHRYATPQQRKDMRRCLAYCLAHVASDSRQRQLQVSNVLNQAAEMADVSMARYLRHLERFAGTDFLDDILPSNAVWKMLNSIRMDPKSLARMVVVSKTCAMQVDFEELFRAFAYRAGEKRRQQYALPAEQKEAISRLYDQAMTVLVESKRVPCSVKMLATTLSIEGKHSGQVIYSSLRKTMAPQEIATALPNASSVPLLQHFEASYQQQELSLVAAAPRLKTRM